MVKHQVHFGKKFYQDKSTGYWISTTSPRIRAHVWVWISHHGKVPPKYHIHHKDENKSNNKINNLELIEGSRHLSSHITKEKREWSKQWIEIIRPMTKAWHTSDEGRQWHREHARKTKFGNWKAQKHRCIFCNTEYETKKRSNFKFCSNKCKSANRRKQGLDDVNRECVFCKALFTVNKYLKTQTCSRFCAANLRRKKRKS